MNETGGREIIAGVHLPDGARVTSITVSVFDSVAANLEVWFQRKSLVDDTSLALGHFVVTGNQGYFAQTQGLDHTTDNALEAYSISILPNGGGWSGDVNLAVQGVVIAWTMN